jgi:Ca2+-binding RTX toxin-like protein
MRRWLTATVCCLALLACSPDTSSPESLPADATTPRNPSRDPGPVTDATEAPPARELSVRRWSRLDCWGRRPTIVGTTTDDRIHGTRAQDVIVSLGGDDVISGLQDRDDVCTGTGDDLVIDTRGGERLVPLRVKLGDGDDRMTVVDFDGTIRAGRGDDTVLVNGQASPNVNLGAGDDLLRSVPHRGRFLGTLELCVSYLLATGPVRVDLARGGATGQGHDRLVNIRCVLGSVFDDVLIGTHRSDGIDARGGLDLVRAGAGNDQVYGGLRADEVHLGPGDDDVFGDAGWDRLYGGPGSDIIDGSFDGDYLDGGAGDDYLHAGHRSCNEDYRLGYSHWALLEGLTFGTAPNELFGRAGNDFLQGDRGNDRLDGGAGVDAGTGGYHDGRIDWITSVERPDECESP